MSDSNPQPNYSYLDAILNQVHDNKIKLARNDKIEALKILKKVYEKVKEKFNSSDSFLKLLTCGETYRGSFFTGVKVGSADEFDMDIKLKLPFRDLSLIEIENSETNHGYIRINLKKAYEHYSKVPSWTEKNGLLKKWMDNDGYLLEREFRAEVERVLQKQFSTGLFELILSDEMKVNAKIRKSGPAFTFHIEYGEKIIDIDFVIVLSFPPSIWPPPPVKTFTKLPEKSQKGWYAVPKPTDCPLDWRISFPFQESYFLGNLNNLKVVYRLLKALRDSQKWNLASYHIATLFLWESETAENNGDSKFWQKSIGNIFIYMLKKLSDYLEEGNIPFFWQSEFNIIGDINATTKINMSKRIKNIIKKIDRLSKDKTDLQKYILEDVFK